MAKRSELKLKRRTVLKGSALVGGAALLGSLPHLLAGESADAADAIGDAYAHHLPENQIYSACQQCNTNCGMKVKTHRRQGRQDRRQSLQPLEHDPAYPLCHSDQGRRGDRRIALPQGAGRGSRPITTPIASSRSSKGPAGAGKTSGNPSPSTRQRTKSSTAETSSAKAAWKGSRTSWSCATRPWPRHWVTTPPWWPRKR
jgi:hypothetical protein